MGCQPYCTRPISNITNTIEFNYPNNVSQDKIQKINSSENIYNIITNNNSREEIILKSNTNYKYFFEIIEQINKYRKKHNVSPLNINNEINIIAQKHSDKIARENYIELSYNKYNNTELGEIIFCFNENNSPEDIIDSFYEEEYLKYDYNNKNPKPSNFTQIIWKNSKYIGIGCSKTKENLIYIVINFYPPGNIKNEFLDNVFPPLKEKRRRKSTASNNSEFKVNFLEEIFNRNNEYREKHGVSLLKLNATLTTKANEYANLMAENNCVMNREIEYLGEKCGINICVKKNDDFDGKMICDEWYEEIKEYNFINMKNNDNEKVKNFTQLIWKETKEVGFGWAYSSKGIFYCVGVYYPSGNIKGKYKENILPEME